MAKVIETGPEPDYVEITELQAQLHVPAAVHQGTLAATGWRPGKQVTAAEYERAIKQFLGSPIAASKGV